MATVSSKLQTLPPRLDWATCDRARLAGDRAFDGLFLTGVRSTRIYFRPVCPVRPARSENATIYATAAAAERAGFPPLSSPSAGNSAGIASVDGHGDDGGTRNAHD